MALSEEDRKEMTSLLAESFAEGMALFRSQAEEEAAKTPIEDKPKEVKGDTGFSLSGFLLGK